MARLTNPQEMELIYQTSKQVFAGVLSATSAAKLLVLKTNASEASLKMYFQIYTCMRKGTCYKMGTSATFTKFLIERIHADEGGDSILYALSAAKQNADFRKQCDNEQPGIEAVCREIIDEQKLKVKYEKLDKYANKGVQVSNKTSIVEKKDVATHTNPDGSLRMKIVIGAIEFEVEGDPKTVIAQHKTFTKDLLPSALASLSKVYDSKTADDTKTATVPKKQEKKPRSSKATNKKKSAKVVSAGTKLSKKYPVVSLLSERMDFKAKMIPLMFLAGEAKIQTSFTVNDVKKLMYDAIGLQVEAKQIKDILQRRPDWFEVEDGKPIKFKLVDIGCDYARNILAEYQ